METESVDVLHGHGHNHISVVRSLFHVNLMDAIFMDVQTVRKPGGLGELRKMHTETKGKCLQNKGYPLKIIWEHEFKSILRSDSRLKEFARQCQSPSYRKHRWITKESTILKAGMNDSLLAFEGRCLTCQIICMTILWKPPLFS